MCAWGKKVQVPVLDGKDMGSKVFWGDLPALWPGVVCAWGGGVKKCTSPCARWQRHGGLEKQSWPPPPLPARLVAGGGVRMGYYCCAKNAQVPVLDGKDMGGGETNRPTKG